jgi:AMP-binding enzyme
MIGNPCGIRIACVIHPFPGFVVGWVQFPPPPFLRPHPRRIARSAPLPLSLPPWRSTSTPCTAAALTIAGTAPPSATCWVAWAEPEKDVLVAAPDAVVDPDLARIGYARADRMANRIANALLASGLGRSDRVAMLCENSIEAFLTKIAIAKAGLAAAPRCRHLPPAGSRPWCRRRPRSRRGSARGTL